MSHLSWSHHEGEEVESGGALLAALVGCKSSEFILARYPITLITVTCSSWMTQINSVPHSCCAPLTLYLDRARLLQNH